MSALLAAAALAACATTTTATAPERRAAMADVPQKADAYFVAGAAVAAAGPSSARARNVILFVGDGMGVTTVTAARIFAGQSQGKDGESHQLTIDTFPNVALSRTYSDDFQIAESAATATAMTTGVKTRGGGVGLMASAGRGRCDDAAAATSRSLFEIAEIAGLSTGVVSTARITHATPAAAYAHTVDRNWENDAEVAKANGQPCPDIARQLIEWSFGDGLEVALGGGRANFLRNDQADPELPDFKGLRADGRDLAGEWAAKPGRAFVWSAKQLAATPAETKVLGLFSPSHMAYERDRAKDVGGEPSLSEMTAAAIARLQRNRNGYVLMVESGRIDHAHHEGRAGEALSETVEFDNAVRTALEMTKREDTLIIVTADHSHTLTMAGYAKRGNPILGLSATDAGPIKALDGLPYTTLGYANGPGAAAATDGSGKRADLTNVDTTAQNFRQPAHVPLGTQTHGGEDVAVYAWGPGDANIRGTIEQNVIFHVMARALGFGAGSTGAVAR